ncbi:MAG: NlpC/P60 family protein, partial [Maribacter sp.]
MQYGICPLSIIALRQSPEESAEMISQLLFGEHFKILESRKLWSKIRTAHDKYEGWVLNRQMDFIPKDEYDQISNSKKKLHCTDLISYVESDKGVLIPILLGSSIVKSKSLPIRFEGGFISLKQAKENFVRTALLYLNSPELCGGRSPFGIDAAGFTQMVYKINGYGLQRTAEQQASQGTALSFVEESEPGDLAFFDNTNGIINHVGIIMENNYIIHVNGRVRIDRIDHTGIFNNDLRQYTHQ